ncbi:MAG: 2-succinyl-5-enolpyruvyl-6-hydroxy-3-cyclohexene-1-carboxylic-acid synthase [Cytophagales bacterium]|nr:MAG: 2-succinyl-5-enolpyruvyl-6-hydroxy-3-cyclohexene-1-carboxylic-acid synthase [Cytophagales bacterium]
MQSIYNIAEICVQKEVTDVVISPGSRSAPLTLAFAQHPLIKTRVISDERSAAFIAIGLTQKSKKTTALVCTSGSAAYNYAPAIAEAYYQQIPLLVLTADRPPEWIDQLDGQTIKQNEIFGKHVKKSFTLPMEDGYEDTRWFIERTISEAINLSQEKPYGPVHINVPLREPLYQDAPITFEKNVKIIHKIDKYYELPLSIWDGLFDEFNSFNKVLIIAGQGDYSQEFIETIQTTIEKYKVVVISDVIGNLQFAEGVVRFHDSILHLKDEYIKNLLEPDLLISFGKSIISKNLKIFLRKVKPSMHWHIQETGPVADTYQTLKRIIPVNPNYFFNKLNEDKIINHPTHFPYFDLWKELESDYRTTIHSFFQQDLAFNEFSVCKQIIDHLPNDSILHLSNSMPVRYANLIALPSEKNIEVYCNRGTSGIDGVMSTAYGAALNTNKLVFLVIGDIAFFYDRNAFWNNYMPSNLRIIVLNNHGGGIFRMIDGPSKQVELEEFFETKQTLKAAALAHEFDLEYYFADNYNFLKTFLPIFVAEKGQSKILEIETSTIINREVYYQFKNLTSKK